LPVAVSESVTIFCPRGGRFSFFNSPYPAHKTAAGVDVYPGRGFGETAPSPVEGKVMQIRKVRCPKGRGFRDEGFDCVILIQSLENPERMIKVLHVAPTVECGETVKPGQDLGRLIRSGYFNFWTDPHIHLEVRGPSDPLRARGGFKFQLLLETGETGPAEELRGTVTENRPEYSLVALEGGFAHGLPARVGGVTGLLDGGIPHYGFVGIHMRGASPGGVVELCGKPIATIRSMHGDMCLAECMDFSLTVDGAPVGLSLYLFPASEPTVKLVPPRPGALRLEENGEVSLEVV